LAISDGYGQCSDKLAILDTAYPTCVKLWSWFTRKSEAMSCEDETAYPSVNEAFSFVVPSYQWALERFERNDSRLQQIVTIAASITVGFPLLGVRLNSDIGTDIDWSLIPLAVAVLLGLAIVYHGLSSQTKRTLKLAGLLNLHREWLSLEKAEFKRDYLFYAGKHQEYNLEAVEWKATQVIRLSYALGAQVLLFLIWIATELLLAQSTNEPASESLFIGII